MSFTSFYSPAGPSSGYGHGSSGLSSFDERLNLGQSQHHSLNQSQAQSPDSNDDTPKKKGGRPRDKAWEFFTDESTKNLAVCRYCSWRTDHPKAFRMRAHVGNCPGLPEELKPLAEGWAEAAKAAEKVSHKRKEPPANGGTANSGTPTTKQQQKAKVTPTSQAMTANPSVSLAHDWSQGPLASSITAEPTPQPTIAAPTSNNANGQHSTQQQPNKRQRTSIIPDPDNELKTHKQAQPQQQQPIHHQAAPIALHSNHAALAASQKAPPPMTARSPITCHVLDSTSGKPAPEMQVRLDRLGPNGFGLLSQSVTDADGRCGQLLTPGTKISPGIFKITFFTSEYFSKRGITSFYPFVEVPFEVKTTEEHYHVPLLLSPFAFSTYRGS